MGPDIVIARGGNYEQKGFFGNVLVSTDSQDASELCRVKVLDGFKVECCQSSCFCFVEKNGRDERPYPRPCG